MFDSISNTGEFLSDHWLSEVFPGKLQELNREWTAAEKAGEHSPRKGLAGASAGYHRLRMELPEPGRDGGAERVTELHELLLTAMGYQPQPQVVDTFQAETEVRIPGLLAAEVSGQPALLVLQAWPAGSEDELLSDEAALVDPVVRDPAASRPERVGTVREAITTVFLTDAAPRYLLVLAADQVLLTDVERWSEGRYLAFDVGTALGRRDTKAKGELAWHAGLWSADVLLPADTGERPRMAGFAEDSARHAVGVSEDLREGLRVSVELIADEALRLRREAGLPVEGVDELPGELTAQSLRFLYRILFLLFAEARPELGILPVGAPEYASGYGIDRLRELVQVPLTPQAAGGHHLHDSLDVLFGLVNSGHGPPEGEDTDGLVFEALRADLFDPASAPLIDRVRLRNQVLQEVLALLLLSKESSRKGAQRGYVSYAQLGINQLGAVYEGLMAYTGFIAGTELVELAKDGDPARGTWLVPPDRLGEYDPKHIVQRTDPVTGQRRQVRHPKGSFVYRLSGRDRQRSASYYTPEVLTRSVVSNSLAELIGDDTLAEQILEYRVCEPALGSGAFANEAINQLAAEYLRRRQRELGETIDPGDYQGELQKVKAHLALHRVYGVDLNATAVELAEVSMWLNVMHPGLRAPWFGLHLRRGNSLVGARRATYDLGSKPVRRSWHKLVPADRPLTGGPPEENEVHHFLLPAAGWGAAGSAKEAKEFAPERAEALRQWSKRMLRPLSERRTETDPGVPGGKRATPLVRLTRLSRRVERLWALARRRLEISEHEIARTIDVWGAPDPVTGGQVPRHEVEQALLDPESPYQRLRLAMDAWCALFFWPVTGDTPDPPELREWLDMLEGLLGLAGREVDAGALTFDTLPTDFLELGELDERERGFSQMTPVVELVARFPWLHQVRRIAQREGFFHWELDFAAVFERGGFDLQVGNPPWVRPTWKDDEILAEFDPYFMLTDKIPAATFKQRRVALLDGPANRSAYLAELSSHAGLLAHLKSSEQHEILKGIQTNLYMLFMERTWRSMRPPAGVVGLLHPEGHFTDPKAGRFRAATYRRLRRHWQFINEGRLFEDVHNQTEFGIQIYSAPREPRFRQMVNLLYPDTAERSLTHDGTGEQPGIKLPNGDWDLRPHAARVVTVDTEVLAQWADLFDEPGTPPEQARLLRPLLTDHLAALAVLAAYPTRMADVGYHWTSGWHEKGAKKDGFIRWDTRTVDSWDEVILQGPHFFVADPFFKQPNQPCTSNKDWSAWDLAELPERLIPRTNYQRACDPDTYRANLPVWDGRPATDRWRLAWRRMTQPSSQRTVISALIPPGPAHVHTIHTLAATSDRDTALVGGLWSSVPVDFLAKVGGKSDLQNELIQRFPAPLDHPAAEALLLRALRLQCLTRDYAPLWQDLWQPGFAADSWTSSFAHLPPLGGVSGTWEMGVPLRTDEARRAALVEIDALTAIMLGLTADHLVSMYTGQMAVLRKYENQMWFDATGRVIAKDNAAKGVRQEPDDFKHLQAHLAGEPSGDLLDRYTPPFRQPDRVAEMRAGHAEFTARLEGTA